MRWGWILLASCAHALTYRGKPLVFGNSTRRRLADSTVFYVKSVHPPPNLVANEVLSSGVYLVRGDVGDMEHGEWTPDLKFDRDKFNASGPWDVVVRTDASELSVPHCAPITDIEEGRVRMLCETSLTELANHDNVLWFSPTPALRLFSYESRRLMLGDAHWNGTGTRIAVSDTGIDEHHCAFYEGSTAPRCSINDARQKIVGICNVPYADTSTVDNSHGTMTAGVAAAWACAYETGVAPQAKIAFVDIGVGENIVPMWPSGLRAKLEATGATVHSASWGDPTSTGAYTDFDSMMDSMSRADLVFVHVRAAGNGGTFSPSSHNAKSGLVVGACLSRPEAYPGMDTSRNPDWYGPTSQTAFSSQGPSLDGRIVPQVCAPGLMVRVAKAFAAPHSGHDDWMRADGTSFACPAIAALVAIVQSRYKELHGVLPSAALVEAALIAHAVKPVRVVDDDGFRLYEVPHPPIATFGTPILDFNRWTDVDGRSVSGTSRVALCFENNDTETWTMSLRWTDPAAVPDVDVALINDLDMIAQSADGRMSVVDDAVNPLEYVRDWTPSHTRLIVSVFGGVATLGAQPFALHIKGKTIPKTCASDVSPHEYSTCADGVRVVTSWDGQTQCMRRACAPGTCGADCAFNCTEVDCVVTDGVGKLDGDGICRPQTCSGEGLFLGNVACECAPLTSARLCANGRLAKCGASKSFDACADGYESVVVSSATIAPISVAAAIAVMFLNTCLN